MNPFIYILINQTSYWMVNTAEGIARRKRRIQVLKGTVSKFLVTLQAEMTMPDSQRYCGRQCRFSMFKIILL